tara:strand:+ start:28400 stop:28852 length:453 start_codon:yes stop_codon:yes gene_type:complete
MTFRVIQFEPWHMKEVLDNPPSDGSLETWRLPEDTNNFEVYYSLGSSFSFVNNGHIIAAFGLKKMWKGHWHIWFFGTDKVHKDGLKIIRFVERQIPILVREKNIKRIQTQVHADWIRAQRSIKILGFIQDGFFKHYGPDGSDYINYRRLF